jgi:cysteinyl-tRNA synthetase
MYVCGVTVYDLCHIGHARFLLVFEVVRRYLAYLGYRVTLVRNFTDVDDKIIQRARETGTSWDEVARRNIDAFRQDMQSLGLPPADVEPKATDHIAEMQAIIQRLVQRGLAYAVGGDVYFSVRSFPGYGKLSRRSPDDLRAGARIEVDERKRDPLDFALWKASKPDEPAWDSPWGRGRPGWHIECSAMAAKHLGESLDIHAGGEDLIFPHHENEIAQSEGATGRPFVRYWLHNGFVTAGGEKMSKSLGNFVTIRDALRTTSPEALKLLLLSTTYRSPLDYTPAAATEKARALAGLHEFLRAVDRLGATPDGAGEPAPEAVQAVDAAFREAMDDDFNTARATGVLFDAAREGNRLLAEAGGRPDDATRLRLGALAAVLRRLGGVLALALSAGQTHTASRSGLRLTRSPGDALAEAEALLSGGSAPGDRAVAVIQELLAHREAARAAKSWAVADEIRQRLAAQGVRLEDTRTATHAVWEPGGESAAAVTVSLVKA